jgi:glycosyltransferase involved in cell wall biosynthesis
VLNPQSPQYRSPPELNKSGRAERREAGPAFNWETRCVAIIPCLNEELSIAALVAGVQHYLKTILVVDDGSSDQTAAVAAAAGAETLRNAQPRGKGATLRLGWAWALEHGFDWALSLDGDGQHSAADIPAFFQYAEHRPASLVVGNRMEQPGAMPALRLFVNRWLSRRLSNATGHFLPDSQCGFRLMNLHAWKALGGSKTEHFEIESEVLFSFASAGEVVGFVPVRALYNREQSKIHPLRDTVRWLRWWRAAKALCPGSRGK